MVFWTSGLFTNHAGILSPALKHPGAVRGTQTGQLRVGATGGQSVCAAAVRVHAHGFVVVRQGSHLRAILKVGPDDAVTVLYALITNVEAFANSSQAISRNFTAGNVFIDIFPWRAVEVATETAGGVLLVQRE